MNAALKQYTDLYAQQSDLIQRQAPAVLNAARHEALTLLTNKGLPTRRTERYKYTDAAAMLAPDYGLNLLRHKPAQSETKCAVPGLRTHTVYVAGDAVMPIGEAKEAAEADGVLVMSMAEAQAAIPQVLETHYNRLSTDEPDALTALNTLLAQDGLVVVVKKGAKPQQPLQIVNTASTRTPAMHNRRLIVICEPQSEATLLVCDHCTANAQTLTTQVSELFIGNGARLNIYGIEETSARCNRLHNIYARQETESQLTLCDVTLRAGLSRTMANVDLRGERAETYLFGAIVAGGTQHIDNNLLVRHQAIGCHSEMLYKSVLDDESLAAFAGKVYVAQGAQQTDSQQTSANLCVSPTARVLTQPMLEIYADDVKCNHGATVGKLDEAALLYMRQRGIPEADARLLLQHAFVSEVIQRIGLPALRDRLTTLVDQRFRGESDAHCAGCGLCGLKTE